MSEMFLYVAADIGHCQEYITSEHITSKYKTLPEYITSKYPKKNY
jgi:hypothetical protein